MENAYMSIPSQICMSPEEPDAFYSSICVHLVPICVAAVKETISGSCKDQRKSENDISPDMRFLRPSRNDTGLFTGHQLISFHLLYR